MPADPSILSDFSEPQATRQALESRHGILWRYRLAQFWDEVSVDTNDREFSTEDSVASVTKIADISEIINPFSSFETGFADVDGAYSITMLVTVVCDAKCSSSFNATVEIPEPATLALFGMGLLMLGAVARRPRKSGPTRGA